MESHQTVTMPTFVESSNPKPKSIVNNSGDLLNDFKDQRKESFSGKSEEFIGFLEVCIHRARDLHNVCIYQNQDVYAKFCLTSEPETVVSTQIINGGGTNPMFNEFLRLNVRFFDSSLKCEIWMLSRIKNYLEDQLLGTTSVPLLDVLCSNGKLEREFLLSSCDLFHAPAGFVELSLKYSGSSPEVFEIPSMSSKDSEILTSIAGEFDKIEFPDLNVASENEIMASEYFRIPCDNLESKTLGSMEENLSTSSPDNLDVLKIESDTRRVSKSSNQDFGVRSLKKEMQDVPSMNANDETPEKLVQKEIVEMYTKSMQQFTESLAKMKLPMDVENGLATSANMGCDEKARRSKNNGPSARVFYGSRAFF